MRLTILGANGPTGRLLTGQALAAGPTGGLLFNKVLQPYVNRVLAKTVHDDMRRLESLLASSDVEWTVLRAIPLGSPTDGTTVFAW